MKVLIFLLLFLNFNLYALEYSKIDLEGCPENSFCKKETGINRKKWLENLRNFSKGIETEQKFNEILQSEFGVPVSGWATEEASLLPNILMWDSPCKQHNNRNNKYYIADIFRKNLNANELKESTSFLFSKVLVQENEKPAYSIIAPRGDAPLFFKEGSLYYLREDDGLFFGLLVDRDGKLRVVKNETSPFLPKEISCPKELVAQFLREAPSPNFYQGQFCKEIWDKTTKSYKVVLLGWSCN